MMFSKETSLASLCLGKFNPEATLYFTETAYTRKYHLLLESYLPGRAAFSAKNT